MENILSQYDCNGQVVPHYYFYQIISVVSQYVLVNFNFFHLFKFYEYN